VKEIYSGERVKREVFEALSEGGLHRPMDPVLLGCAARKLIVVALSMTLERRKEVWTSRKEESECRRTNNTRYSSLGCLGQWKTRFDPLI
jgi:hypothetical protein